MPCWPPKKQMYPMPKVSAKALDAVLPQTQCGECGYPGCLPYAEALAHGKASIDCCPPGGLKTLHALANLMQIDAKPFEEKVARATRPPQTAIIREAECIGCTKCIPACPVDAIIGRAKHMHNILPDACTGCGLCIAPCPVDCIELVEIPTATYDPNTAREHFHAKKIRELRETQEKEKLYQAKRRLLHHKKDPEKQDAAAKRAYILDALKRSQKN